MSADTDPAVPWCTPREPACLSSSALPALSLPRSRVSMTFLVPSKLQLLAQRHGSRCGTGDFLASMQRLLPALAAGQLLAACQVSQAVFCSLLPPSCSYTVYAKHWFWGKVVGQAGQEVLELETRRSNSRQFAQAENGAFGPGALRSAACPAEPLYGPLLFLMPLGVHG